MAIENAPSSTGKEAAKGLHRAARSEERKVEAAKGSDLAKGADRVEERAKSSDSKSAGKKQKL